MRLASYRYRGQGHVGAVDADMALVCPLLDCRGEFVTAMLDLVSARTSLAQTQLGQAVPMSDIELLAPIPRPARNIFCVGKNYREHAQEFTRSGFDSSASSLADAVPDAPIIFTKAPECVIASGQPILAHEAVTGQLDYEAELAVIIGKGGRGITAERALDHVFGYTIVNDVTARDLQARHKQWFLGKSLDTFCPMGPVLVTADDWNPVTASIKCWVNEELRQDAPISDLIFDIPTLIATISAGITLYPGDVIATGTPAGVGIGFRPARFMKSGDTVRIEVSGLGVLQNRVA
ncbi:MAG TPA: fumarylacetoacetate hydrolase family protein [Ramlibacter sp.]|nr:fumarylacetoacetate hydrolase family protein [Ramlibacter sp.]